MAPGPSANEGWSSQSNIRLSAEYSMSLFKTKVDAPLQNHEGVVLLNLPVLIFLQGHVISCFKCKVNPNSSWKHLKCALQTLTVQLQPWRDFGPVSRQLHDMNTVLLPGLTMPNFDTTSPAILQVDCSVTFEDVGGMDHHLAVLKEMVFMPLKYPALCARMKITAPGGVIFHGPPGTGGAFGDRSGRDLPLRVKKTLWHLLDGPWAVVLSYFGFIPHSPQGAVWTGTSLDLCIFVLLMHHG